MSKTFSPPPASPEASIGSADPNEAGISAPVGSMYVQSGTKLWIRTGPGEDDWSPVDKNTSRVVLIIDLLRQAFHEMNGATFEWERNAVAGKWLAKMFWIDGIKIMNRAQLPEGGVPATAFARVPGRPPPPFRFETIQVASDVVFDVTYRGEHPDGLGFFALVVATDPSGSLLNAGQQATLLSAWHKIVGGLGDRGP